MLFIRLEQHDVVPLTDRILGLVEVNFCLHSHDNRRDDLQLRVELVVWYALVQLIYVLFMTGDELQGHSLKAFRALLHGHYSARVVQANEHIE